MKYRLTYKSEKKVKLYDAEEGIYFDKDEALELYDLMVSELKKKAEHFSVKLEELADCPGVIVSDTLETYSR